MNPAEHPADKPSAEAGLAVAARSSGYVSGRRGRSKRSARVFPMMMLIVMAFAVTLALGVTPALAVLKYPYVGRITSGLRTPRAVVVNGKNGDTLVAASYLPPNFFEPSPPVIDVYEPSGELVQQWSGANTPAGSFADAGLTVAAYDATGDVYTVARDGAASHRDVIDKFTGLGDFICQITGTTPLSEEEKKDECNGAAGSLTPNGALSEGTGSFNGLAVDQATGDVYVVELAHEVVDVFSPSGAYATQISGASTPAGAFKDIRGVAVDDATGNLLLADRTTSEQAVVYVFDAATGAYVETWDGSAATNFPGTPAGSFGGGFKKAGIEGIATNDATGDVYVADRGDHVIDDLSGTGGYVAQITGIPGHGFGAIDGVAVAQASGEVYVSEESESGEPAIDVFDGEALLYPDATTGEASEVRPGFLKLNGEVDAEGVALTGCRFEYVEAAKYRPAASKPYEDGGIAACVPSYSEIPADLGEHAVHADLTGLRAGVTYHFRLTDSNQQGTEVGLDREVQTPPAPKVESASSSNETATAATLEASIDPSGFATTYRFEYGTSTVYGSSVPVPDGSIGAGTGAVAVSEAISGLSANVTYHWRVIATSEAGTTTTPDHTFVYDTSGSTLPDGRAYEMVTPPYKNGALLGGSQVFKIANTFAEDGTRMIRTTVQCFTGAQSCSGQRNGLLGTPYSFERTPAGWVSTALAPPATQFEEVGAWGADASNDLSLFGAPTGPEGQEVLYERRPDGSLAEIGPVTEPGRQLIDIAHQATPDLSHLVFELANDYKWSFDATEGSNAFSLYEYSGLGNSTPALVGVSGGRGSTSLISRCGSVYGSEAPYTSADGESVSENGETVFFTAAQCTGGSGVNQAIPVPAATLYARIGGAETVKISEPFAPDCKQTGCQKSKPAAGVFQGASRDGTRAFFTSTQRLTDQASEGEENLYEAELGRNETSGATEVKHLIAISAGDSSGEGPRVQGMMAVAPDGSHIYFVAQGVLSGEERAGCKARFEAAGVPEEGRCLPSNGANNLYVYRRDAGYPEGHVAFVATLSSLPEEYEQRIKGDASQWNQGDGVANVTPEGRYIVFTSDASLTPDDTSVNQAQQVFRYDDQSGALTRLSFGVDGYDDNGNAGVADARIAPPGGSGNLIGPPRSDPTMANDGAYVFFQSPVALTPRALNDVRISSGASELEFAQNVYEWEAQGAGSCTQAGGCVQLISDGHDTAVENTSCSPATNSAVCLIGADVSGRNVFFTSTDQLVRSDTDTQLDVYDARICGEEGCIQPAPQPPPPCLGEACHGTPAAIPAVPGVPSVSFDGAVNLSPPPLMSAGTPKAPTRAQKLAKALKACHAKRNRRGRSACERAARRAYGAKAKAKSKSHGRAK